MIAGGERAAFCSSIMITRYIHQKPCLAGVVPLPHAELLTSSLQVKQRGEGEAVSKPGYGSFTFLTQANLGRTWRNLYNYLLHFTTAHFPATTSGIPIPGSSPSRQKVASDQASQTAFRISTIFVNQHRLPRLSGNQRAAPARLNLSAFRPLGTLCHGSATSVPNLFPKQACPTAGSWSTDFRRARTAWRRRQRYARFPFHHAPSDFPKRLLLRREGLGECVPTSFWRECAPHTQEMPVISISLGALSFLKVYRSSVSLGLTFPTYGARWWMPIPPHMKLFGSWV